jgi:hypothetical protein
MSAAEYLSMMTTTTTLLPPLLMRIAAAPSQSAAAHARCLPGTAPPPLLPHLHLLWCLPMPQH